MDAKEQFAALADLAESLGMEIRRAPAAEGAERPGGAVIRLKGRQIVFLDESAPAAERAAVLAGALAERPEVADMFLPPQLREIIERARGDAPA